MSLKAELLRKQEEVNRFKKPNTLDPFTAFVPKRLSNSGSRSHNKKKSDTIPKANAEKTENDKRADEDHEMLAKSKRVLEAKAKLYDRMTSSGGSLKLNADDTCLVRFNQKKQDDRRPIESSSESESESESEDHRGDSDHDDDDKWTEYTDCLGRTRKCLKEDLEFFKKKDLDLVDATKNRVAQPEETDEKEAKEPWFVDTKGISSADLPLYQPTNDDDTMSMLSKSSKMEEMRVQWGQKEQENLHRDQIHYQDVLFDEARTHGVGYYAFSVDAIEREKQQKVLEQEREKTLEEQRKREQTRLARERIVTERVFAAKNRQRARLGLAPLSREEYEAAKKKEKGDGDDADDKDDKSKDDGKEKKREEKEKRKKEKEEREREEKRQQHLRPWDAGKDNAPRRATASSDEDEWKYKPEKPEPMSQYEWNEMKRTERNPDFAPPTMETMPTMDTFNRFTTKKPKPMKRRNEASYGNMYNEPIRNELDGNDFPVDDDQNQDDSSKRKRAEVPPPPTFDYYGPSSSSKPKPKVRHDDITTSIEAGLKFLREKSDKIAPGTKQSWVANTTYEE